MTSPNRISVVGPSGSGKTYLARQLADLLKVPVYELDQLKRRADGSTLSVVEFGDIVNDLALSDAWIIDGHYGDVRHLIGQRCDAVIWPDYRLSLVSLRLLRRFIQKRKGKVDGLTRELAPSQVLRQPRPSSNASGRQRLGCLYRTLEERREYLVLLRSPTYDRLALIELKSPRRKRKWLSNVGDNRGPERWSARGDKEADSLSGAWLIHPDYDPRVRSANPSPRNRRASSASTADSPKREKATHTLSHEKAKPRE